MDLSEISRTVNVWAHFLNLEPPSLHTCMNSCQTYVLFTRINFIIIVIRFFTLPKISTISFQRKYPPLTNQYQSRLEINPRSTVSRAKQHLTYRDTIINFPHIAPLPVPRDTVFSPNKSQKSSSYNVPPLKSNSPLKHRLSRRKM